MEITIDRMKELEQKPEFIRDLQEASSIAAVTGVMEKYGVSVTEKEISEGYLRAKEIFEKEGYLESGELTEKALDAVAGGVNAAVYSVGLLMAAGIAVSPWLWAGGLVVMTAGVFMK